jgi:nucleotide-binding universal stress UspA family protein
VTPRTRLDVGAGCEPGGSRYGTTGRERVVSKKIIVGIDGSASAVAALSWATERARADGATLCALHVVERPESHELYAMPVVADLVYSSADEVDPVRRRTMEALFAAVHPEAGWELRFAQGHPGHMLVEESKEADLLVVGSREHVGLNRLVTGSVSHYCLSHAQCPMVAVPPHYPVRAHAPADGKTVQGSHAH